MVRISVLNDCLRNIVNAEKRCKRQVRYCNMFRIHLLVRFVPRCFAGREETSQWEGEFPWSPRGAPCAARG